MYLNENLPFGTPGPLISARNFLLLPVTGDNIENAQVTKCNSSHIIIVCSIFFPYSSLSNSHPSRDAHRELTKQHFQQHNNYNCFTLLIEQWLVIHQPPRQPHVDPFPGVGLFPTRSLVQPAPLERQAPPLRNLFMAGGGNNSRLKGAFSSLFLWCRPLSCRHSEWAS